MMITPCYFIDLDTQYDFIDHQGNMALLAAQSIVPNLKLLTRHALKNKITVLAGVEIYDSQELTSTKHRNYCLRHSKGSRKIAETSLKKNFVIEKHSDYEIDYQNLLSLYSQIIFEKENFDFFGNLHILKLLQHGPIRNCVVYGVALDYGLQMAVVRLLKEGFQVWIPVDAVWAINEENREKVLIELRKLGAHMWNTAFILENTLA